MDEKPLNLFQHNICQLFDVLPIEVPALRSFLQEECQDKDKYLNHKNNHFRYIKNFHLKILTSADARDHAVLLEKVVKTDFEFKCPICTRKDVMQKVKIYHQIDIFSWESLSCQSHQISYYKF